MNSKNNFSTLNLFLKICGIILILLGLYYIYMNKTIIYTLKIDGNNFIENQKLECKTNRKTKKCSITLPNESNDLIYYKYKENVYDQGDKITITDNIEMIAYEEEPIELTVTIDSEKYSCFTSVRKHNCNVKLPEIENGQAFTTNINTKDILYDGGQTININDDLTLYKTKEEIKEITLSANILGNKLDKDNKLTCKTTNKEHTCKVKLPTLSKLDYGYSKNTKNEQVYYQGNDLVLTENLTLYVIKLNNNDENNNIIKNDKEIKDNSNQIITLTINGNKIVDSKSLTCISVNGSCSIKLPTLSNQNLGYNDTKTSKDIKYKQGETIILNSNKTIYVVQEETVTFNLTINLNGATSISNNNLSCKTTKSINSCTVTLPTGTRTNGEFLGYNDTNSNEVKYKEGSTYTLNSNSTLYAVSAIKHSATVTNADYVFINGQNNKVITCNAYNTDNSCSIILPKFYKLSYTKSQTYTYNNQEYNIGSKLELTSDITLKANPQISQYSSVLDLEFDEEIYNNTVILYSKKIKDQSVNRNYIEEIKRLAPYMLQNTDALMYITDAEMAKVASEVNSYPVGFTANHTVHVRNSVRIKTTVHELMHSETNTIKSVINKDKGQLAKDIGVYSVYSKYQNSDDGPLESYAYTSINEFLSVCYSYYYDRYIAKTKTTTLPDELVKGMERLICIIKDYENNYSNYNTCLTKY